MHTVAIQTHKNIINISIKLLTILIPPGYRHISLRNELNQPQGLATIFVHLSVRDYVPDAFAGRNTSNHFYPVTCNCNCC